MTRLARDFTPAARAGQVRWRRIQTRKYKEPDYEKKLMLAVCEPMVQLDRRPMYDKCTGIKLRLNLDKWADPHPWERILANDLRDELSAAQLIAVFHQNAIKQVEQRAVRNMLHKKGFVFRHCNRMVYYLATHETKFATLTPMLSEVQNNVIVTSKSADVAELLKLDKKMHEYTLLYAVVHDRLVRKDELVDISKLPSVDSLRAQLCGTLDHSAQMLSANIGHHLSALSANLEQYVKQNSTAAANRATPSSSAPTSSDEDAAKSK